MNNLDSDLAQRLDSLRDQGLYRELRPIDSPQTPRLQLHGQTLLNFSSNDYLGLANDPLLKEAAIKAVEHYGAGAGASRLICGSLRPHHELDETLAAFKATEAALSFSTGYAAASGAICALLDQNDVIILDKLVHACIVDAARLCGAKLRVFRHNDLNNLEHILKWATTRSAITPLPRRSPAAEGRSRITHHASRITSPASHPPRLLIVTESVFSMDGDHAPLRELADLKDKYGAWLMVDEAHATGLYGPNRRGLAEELGVSDRIEVQMGTLGKALGASGGFIAGSRTLIDYLVNRARSFIFSTAPVPAAAAAAAAAIRFVQSEPGNERRTTLWHRVSLLNQPNSPPAGKPSPPAPPCLSTIHYPLSTNRSAIIPLLIGDETKAVEAAAALRSQGIFIPAIRYPTVARGQARLRLTLTAAHTPADIAQLLTALKPVIPGSLRPSQCTSNS